MSPYSKQVWTPNVSPVTAAAMNHIEDGIFAVDTKPSAAITYIGAYDNAHVYADGDYVIGPDGLTYQCVVGGTVGVTPTPWNSGQWGIPQPVVNGQWIKGVGGAAVWAPIGDADITAAAPRLSKANNQVTDCNNMLDNGWYRSANATNGPPSITGHASILVVALDGPPAVNLRQIAYDYNSDAIWMRRRTDGNWGAWSQVQPVGGTARAGARVNANGTLQGPAKALTVVRTGVGAYNVNVTFSSGNMMALVTPWSLGIGIAIQNSATQMLVGLYSQAGAPTDIAFSVAIFDMDTWP
jgi:hypothetical protein